MTRSKTGGLTLSSILLILPFLGAPMCGSDIHDNVVNIEEVNIGVGNMPGNGNEDDTGTTTTDTGTMTTPCTPEPIVFYDGLDQDCDGLDECDADDDGVDSGEGACTWGTDCNDADPTLTVMTEWYADLDGDAFSSADAAISSCGSPGAGYSETLSAELDCDDADVAINPDADEICDSMDNDCDLLVDDADDNTVGQSTWYPDERRFAAQSDGRRRLRRHGRGHVGLHPAGGHRHVRRRLRRRQLRRQPRGRRGRGQRHRRRLRRHDRRVRHRRQPAVVPVRHDGCAPHRRRRQPPALRSRRRHRKMSRRPTKRNSCYGTISRGKPPWTPALERTQRRRGKITERESSAVAALAAKGNAP